MKTTIKICLLSLLLIPSLIGCKMLNYINPTYNIIEMSQNNWGVEVKIELDKSPATEKGRIKLLNQEADKSSLFSMAFVQKLANDGDEQAKQIQSLYQAYREYLKNGDISIIKKASTDLLKKDTDYTFPKESAHYILNLIAKQPFDSQSSAKTLLNKLIPGLEKTLTHPRPQKIHAEQEVCVPEMKNVKHKAFPDLIKFDGVYYAAYREAGKHGGFKDLGSIRILKGYYEPNQKAWKWENMQLLEDPIYDLRDPRFFVNQENKLQLVLGGSIFNEKHETVSMVPHIAILENGHWQLQKASVDLAANGVNGQWIWRVTWNPFDKHGYAFSYGKGIFSLVKTADGKTFKKITDIAKGQFTDLSETTIRFKKDGTALAFIRAKKEGIIGVSDSSNGYQTWKFNVIPFRVGGPNFVISNDEQSIWAATRYFFLHPNNELDEATILGSMSQTELTPLLRLKSSYDSSYPGIVFEEDGTLTILYYSSSLDDTSSLYITKIAP